MPTPNRPSWSVTCIIPFFNEGSRALRVLEAITHSGTISQIICVDDGSADETYKKIQKDYARVEVIRSGQNAGKSQAIAEGLAHARENNILLFDADLERINIDQLDTAIAAFLSSPQVDMLVLRRMNDLLLSRILRIDVVLSGERLVRKSDLEQVLKTDPLGYQLELAINSYMVAHGRFVYWMPLSSSHMIKVEKYGVVSGLLKELHQYYGLIRFKGPIGYFWNLFTFCPREFRYQRELIRSAM